MAKVLDLLSYDNEVFRAYCFWSAVLVLKMLLMSLLTGMQRFKNKAFVNPEDAIAQKVKVKFDDPDVERVRRAHRNDLENILPFFTIGFIYVLINPSAAIAINLFRAVAISRIAHTLVYAVFVVPQPSRAIAWFVCLGSTVYMTLQCVMFFL